MAPLKLVHSQDRPRENSLSPLKLKMLRADSAALLYGLKRKLDRLNQVRPLGVEAVARLVDDFLADADDEAEHRAKILRGQRRWIVTS
jgi:hypothetical protein